jgi:hypothetical protein
MDSLLEDLEAKEKQDQSSAGDPQQYANRRLHWLGRSTV